MAKPILQRLPLVVTSIAFPLLLLLVFVGHSYGFQLLNRSLSMLSSVPSANTSHIISFTFPVADVVGSIEFQYCETELLSAPCNPPAGLDVSQANLSNQSGDTGFSILSQSSNTIIISRNPSNNNATADQFTFSNITNPSALNQYFFIRILTFPTSDASGAYNNLGNVVNSTSQAVSINTVVPPFLYFCVGQQVASDCSTSSGNFYDLGNLSTSSTATTTSQFAVATNAVSGAGVSIYGTTMTAGNNVIQQLTTPTTSVVGASQFGINLRANSVPRVGSDPLGIGVISPANNYNQPNKFLFNQGDLVASSIGPTDFKTLTASYIVNIAQGQAPGIYTTTMSYICTANF